MVKHIDNWNIKIIYRNIGNKLNFEGKQTCQNILEIEPESYDKYVIF